MQGCLPLATGNMYLYSTLFILFPRLLRGVAINSSTVMGEICKAGLQMFKDVRPLTTHFILLTPSKCVLARDEDMHHCGKLHMSL